jgi:hypothetical protein
VILEMHKVINIDTTGTGCARSAAQDPGAARRQADAGGPERAARIAAQPLGLMNEIGLQNVFDDLEHALDVAAIPPASDAARVFAKEGL